MTAHKLIADYEIETMELAAPLCRCGHEQDMHETEDDNAYCMSPGCACRFYRPE